MSITFSKYTSVGKSLIPCIISGLIFVKSFLIASPKLILKTHLSAPESINASVGILFETALKRENYKKGYIVAFSFTKGAYEEVARTKSKGELEIKLITIEELLEKKKPII